MNNYKHTIQIYYIFLEHGDIYKKINKQVKEDWNYYSVQIWPP